MITVMSRDTCKPAYIDEKLIDRIEECSEDIDGRAYPYSRVYIKDPKQKHNYFLDVVESAKKIGILTEAAGFKTEKPKDNL